MTAIEVREPSKSLSLSVGGAGPQGPSGWIELESAVRTSTFTQTGVGSSDVTGMSLTADIADDRPYYLEFNSDSVGNNNLNGITYVKLQEGATVLAFATIHMYQVYAFNMPVTRRVRLTPSIGSHTYKVVLQQATQGNSQIIASTDSPMVLSLFKA